MNHLRPPNPENSFGHFENRESEFKPSVDNKGQVENARQRLISKIDSIGRKLPTSKIFNNFQRSFKGTEQDFGLVIDVDGGKYSIIEILTHIETRLNSPDQLLLKPNIEAWINALPKVIY